MARYHDLQMCDLFRCWFEPPNTFKMQLYGVDGMLKPFPEPDSIVKEEVIYVDDDGQGFSNLNMAANDSSSGIVAL